MTVELEAIPARELEGLDTLQNIVETARIPLCPYSGYLVPVYESRPIGGGERSRLWVLREACRYRLREQGFTARTLSAIERRADDRIYLCPADIFDDGEQVLEGLREKLEDRLEMREALESA